MFKQSSPPPIEKKIGQLFFIGISGVEVDAGSSSFLSEISPGGVCLFARNIKSGEQTRRLLDQIRESSDIAPFLSIDQEGGVVDRLRRILTAMPAASKLKTVENARTAACLTAETLKILGFNMNFAPVVDVLNRTHGTATNGLYSRGFGGTLEETAALSGAYLQSLQSNGILGCLKHFPGLGASQVDSHEELPEVLISRKELEDTDLMPYRSAIEQNQASAVMTAHAVFPEIDLQETGANGKLVPSSLSYNFTTKLLRDTLKFTGVAITDDLEMGAIVRNYGIGEASVMAVRAGADMLAVCADSQAVRNGFDAVRRAVDDGVISIERIDESVERIARLKSRISPPVDFNEARLEDLSNEIAEFSKTLG